MQKSLEIIENWFENINNDGHVNVKYAYVLTHGLSNYFANKKTYEIFIGMFKNDYSITYESGDYNVINLYECIYFDKFQKNEYDFFVKSDKKYGFFCCYVLSVRCTVYVLFNEIKKDTNNIPLFSGIVESENYLGSIKNNLFNGFGLLYYRLPISQNNILGSDDFDYGEIVGTHIVYEYLLYSGCWVFGKKNGIGIIFNNNFYRSQFDSSILADRRGYKTYYTNDYHKDILYFIGRWENDKLVKIYYQNESQWQIIKQLVNYQRFYNEKYPNVVIDCKEASDITVDEISDLFLKYIEPLTFPAIK